MIAQNAPERRLARWGRTSWNLVGILLVAALAIALAYWLRSIVVPFAIAVVLGILFEPAVAFLARKRIPRSIGAAVVLVGLVLILAAAIAVVVQGIASQWDEITIQLESAAQQAQNYLSDLGVDTSGLEDINIPDGFVGSILSGVSTAFGVVFGVFIGAIILYLTLADANLWTYAARFVPLPTAQAEGIVEDSFDAVRGYFKGQTIVGLFNFAGTWIGLLIIGVPSAFAIGLVTFVTCYIPYLGAFIAGAFAVFIAFGSGGVQLALLALVVVLLVQNVFQSLISPYAFASTLSLHPIVVLVGTIAGGILAGVFGAMLATPIIAVLTRAVKRIRAAEAADAARAALGLPGDDLPGDGPGGVVPTGSTA